jgi:hypothetical protein
MSAANRTSLELRSVTRHIIAASVVKFTCGHVNSKTFSIGDGKRTGVETTSQIAIAHRDASDLHIHRRIGCVSLSFNFVRSKDKFQQTSTRRKLLKKAAKDKMILLL